MANKLPVEKHLKAKKYELIWALARQDYKQAEIARMFNIDRSTVLRIIRLMPRDWSSPWHKIKQ